MAQLSARGGAISSGAARLSLARAPARKSAIRVTMPASPRLQPHAARPLLPGLDQPVADDLLDRAHQVARAGAGPQAVLLLHHIDQQMRVDATGGDLQPVAGDHRLDLECRHARHVQSGERAEHEDAVQPVQHLGCEPGQLQRVHRGRAHRLRIGRMALRDFAQRIGRDVGGQHEDGPRGGNLGAGGCLRHVAVVPGGEELLEDVRMRLFDLIQQHQRVWHFLQPAGQLAVGVRADIALGRAEQLGGGVRAAHLRHVEMQQLAPECHGEALGEIGLAGAGRAGEQEDAHRLAAHLQGQAAAQLAGDVLAHRILADHLRLQRVRQRHGVDHGRLFLPGQQVLEFGAVGQAGEHVHHPSPAFVRPREAACQRLRGCGFGPPFIGQAGQNTNPQSGAERGIDGAAGRQPGQHRLQQMPGREMHLHHDLHDRQRQEGQHHQRHQLLRRGQDALHWATTPASICCPACNGGSSSGPAKPSAPISTTPASGVRNETVLTGPTGKVTTVGACVSRTSVV